MWILILKNKEEAAHETLEIITNVHLFYFCLKKKTIKRIISINPLSNEQQEEEEEAILEKSSSFAALLS